MPAFNNRSSRGAERRGDHSATPVNAEYRNSTGFNLGASRWMMPKAKRYAEPAMMKMSVIASRPFENVSGRRRK